METRDRLLTVEELADYLDVPVATIYAWRYRRQGPRGFRVGRYLRFRWGDVEDWINHLIDDTRHSRQAQSTPDGRLRTDRRDAEPSFVR